MHTVSNQPINQLLFASETIYGAIFVIILIILSKAYDAFNALSLGMLVVDLK